MYTRDSPREFRRPNRDRRRRRRRRPPGQRGRPAAEPPVDVGLDDLALPFRSLDVRPTDGLDGLIAAEIAVKVPRENEDGQRFVFPDGFTLDVGENVTVHGGAGSDTETDVYWGAASGVLDEDGDTITVRTADGREVLREPFLK